MDDELLASTGRRPRASNAIACTMVIGMVILLLYIVAWGIRFCTVDLTIVFAEDPEMPASAVPYWNRPGFPIDPASVHKFAFIWWVYATDIFDMILLIYVPLALLLGLTCGFRTIGVTGVTIAIVIVLLLQLAKAVYFSLYLFSLFGLKCIENGFCINRDLGKDPASPDPTFWIQTIITYILVVLTILLLFIPSAYRAATRSTNLIYKSRQFGRQKKMDDESELSSTSTRSAAALALRTKKKPTKAAKSDQSMLFVPSIEFPSNQDE